MAEARFEWDPKKERENQEKHDVSSRLVRAGAVCLCRPAIAEDASHSSEEKRYFCFGWVKGGVLAVRFTYRHNVIRIFGAGYWRKGKRIYERENQIYRRVHRKPTGHS